MLGGMEWKGKENKVGQPKVVVNIFILKFKKKKKGKRKRRKENLSLGTTNV